MKNLIVCRAPGDEVAAFGGLILAQPEARFDVIAVFAHPLQGENEHGQRILERACAELNVTQARLLPFAFIDESQDVGLISEALGDLSGYARVYTHSVQDASRLAQYAAAATGAMCQQVWTLAGGGVVDETVTNAGAVFQRRLDILNRHYADLLREDHINPATLRNVDLFQRIDGASLFRYFKGTLDWHANEFDYAHPWDLETSAYERMRYAAELETLSGLPWSRLIEVGACEGAFTQVLLERFPDRDIVAYEPDRHFYERLCRRVGARAKTRCADGEAAGTEPCDVLYLSSAIYYFWRLPYRMLAQRPRYVVASHAARYHRERLDPMLRAAGYVLKSERDVLARVEPIEGVLSTRYGTNIKVWHARESGR